MLGTMYGHFAIRRSAVVRAVGAESQLDSALFTMEILGPTGVLHTIEARSCPEAQDRTTYPPIRSSFLVATPLHISRIRLTHGRTVLFDKRQAFDVKPGLQLVTDWILGTDAIAENEFFDTTCGTD